MASSRGLDRLLAFSDATVAIAMTLLILPLVEIAQEVEDRPVGEFLDDHSFALISFALSFVVISVFWRNHHVMYEDVERSGPALVRANLVWLAAIVFLPFPTELLDADHDQRLTHGIYVGTLVIASASQSVQKWLILRDGGTSSPIRGDLISLALMVIALVVVVGIPAIGMWGLLVLLLAGPVERVLKARIAA
ncbi:MAG: TMEM175 family protein [Aeromicrobium sp.]